MIDQGIGIPPEQLSQIFERFYQVEYAGFTHRGGAGLGLSIVQRILEAHGGSISVSSVVGRAHVHLRCRSPAPTTHQLAHPEKQGRSKLRYSCWCRQPD